jgi:hypothetical protein
MINGIEHYVNDSTAQNSVTVSNDGVETLYVSAEEFMAVQHERDNMKRSLALVNEALHGRVDVARALLILEKAGLTAGDAEAMRQLLAHFGPTSQFVAGVRVVAKWGNQTGATTGAIEEVRPSGNVRVLWDDGKISVESTSLLRVEQSAPSDA